MSLLFISLLATLGSAALLILSPSLPLQAFALLLISGATAATVASSFSILLGIYTILIYASGLLVLLAYFVALSPNQTLNTPSQSTNLILFSTIILILASASPSSNQSHLFDTSLAPSNVITVLTPSSASLLILIALILVLTIIAVVNVSSLSSGPVRPWTS